MPSSKAPFRQTASKEELFASATGKPLEKDTIEGRLKLTGLRFRQLTDERRIDAEALLRALERAVELYFAELLICFTRFLILASKIIVPINIKSGRRATLPDLPMFLAWLYNSILNAG